MIEDIINSIREKDNRLKIKVERAMDILIDSITDYQQLLPKSEKKHIDNEANSSDSISKVSYGIAGVLAIAGCFSNESRGWLFASAAAIGLAGYVAGKGGQQKEFDGKSSVKRGNRINKSEIEYDVLNILREIKEDWEQFMIGKQHQVRSLIAKAPISETEREMETKKIYVFIEIEFSLLEASNLIEKAEGESSLVQTISDIKNKYLQAIDSACQKQQEIYKSLSLG